MLREDAYAARDPMTRKRLLDDLALSLANEVELDRWLADAAERMASALDAERATVWLIDARTDELVSRVAVLPELDRIAIQRDRGIVGFVATHARSVRIDDALEDPRFDASFDKRTGFHTRSVVAAPVMDERGATLGVLQVLDRRVAHFGEEDEALLSSLGRELGRALALTTLAQASDAERPGLELRGPFNRIVGRSAAMEPVYERIVLAAQSDATVLLCGETGTGKSLLARAIHVNSRRHGEAFVVLDCTTLPPQLVESELFGHERGAFTGADRRVRGKVELADRGTLFLDEVGDLPLEAQGKLLRLLQDRELERVGGRDTLKVDLRIVAATHRDLAQKVRDGSFRADLFYRLRVVEIDVPPLRSRGAHEIETLALHFAELYAKRYGKPRVRFEPAALDLVATHSFPGNVRELEHWVESAVVLSSDGVIRASRVRSIMPPPLDEASSSLAADGVVLPFDLTLDEASRAYAAASLERLGGNQSEAARRLGVARNTLAKLTKSPASEAVGSASAPAPPERRPPRRTSRGR